MKDYYKILIFLNCVFCVTCNTLRERSVLDKLRNLEEDVSWINNKIHRMEKSRRNDLRIFENDISIKIKEMVSDVLSDVILDKVMAGEISSVVRDGENSLWKRQNKKIRQLKILVAGVMRDKHSVITVPRKIDSQLKTNTCKVDQIQNQIKELGDEVRNSNLKILGLENQLERIDNEKTTGGTVQSTIGPTTYNPLDTITETINIQPTTMKGQNPPVVRIDPRYLQLNVGDSSQFRCIADSNPPATIVWTRGENGPLPDSATVENGVFRIPSVQKRDEAEYYCKATSPAGTSTVRTILYVTGSVPEPEVTIVVRRTAVTAIVGTTVTLECYSQNGGDVILVWSLDRQGLPSGSSQDNGVLTLPNVQPSYSGSYMCTGTTPSGKTGIGRTTLTIQPDVEREAPVVKIEEKMQVIPTGTTGTIRCIVSGLPKPTITWKRARGELSNNHQVSQNGEILRITKASMADRGVYICLAENVAGRAMASAMIDVERREIPVVELYPSGTLTIGSGGSALFQCRVTSGNPAPRVTWTRVGDEPFTSTTDIMEENGVIMFKGVTGDEQGSYVCTAVNSMGTVTATAVLRIEGPPKVTVSPRRQVTSIEGDRVALECTGEGEPTPNVFWRSENRSDVLSEASDEDDGSTSLIFESVAKSDEGRYICIATNDKGRDEATVDLTVVGSRGVRPSVVVDIQGPERMSLVDGQSVELTCSAQGLQSPVIRWRRPGNQPLPPNHSVRNGVLYIPQISSEYQGEYVCVVTGGQGNQFTASVILIVSVTPRVTITPAQEATRPGQTVRLNCQPAGSGPFKIQWTNMDGVMSPTAIERDGVLEIRQVTAADAGEYRCIATNNAGSSEGYAVIEVSVPPTVMVGQKSQIVNVGQTVELRCEVSGNPPPTVRWEKDEGSLPLQHQVRNGVLTIYGVSAEDSGRYICTAGNEAGSNRDFTYLQVQSGPVVNPGVSQSVQRVDVGDRVDFKCIVSGTPRPTVTWSKLEGALPASAVISEGTLTSTLIIPEVRPEDAGIYRCTASNEGGSVQSQAQLFVTAQPVISVPQDIKSAALGGPATLSCDAQGYPSPSISWSKQEGDLPRDHSVTDGQLSIPRVREEDGGTYICNATNRYGTDQKPIVLVVGEIVIGSSFEVTGDGYVELDKGLLPQKRRQTGESIEMMVQTVESDGLLFWQGQDPNTRLRGGDYVAIVLADGFVEFRYELGSGEANIRSNSQIDDGFPHKIIAQRVGRTGNLTVDAGPPVIGVSVGPLQILSVKGNIYLGGLPDLDVMTDEKVKQNYNGCIIDVVIQNKDPIDVSRDVVSSFNIHPCLEVKK